MSLCKQLVDGVDVWPCCKQMRMGIIWVDFRHAEAGDFKKAGFSSSAYGMSKVGLWRATAILAEQYKSDPRHILINAVRFTDSSC